MLRRHAGDPGETKIYLSSAPPDTPHETLVWLAGTPWPVKSAILEATSEPGLDHHEVRGWHHHTTLALLAMAFLLALRQDWGDRHPTRISHLLRVLLPRRA